MQTTIEVSSAQHIRKDVKSSDDFIERIYWNDQPLVYIIRSGVLPEKTTFLTPPEFKQQVGFVVYPQGGEIARHIHRNLERHLVGTSEVLIVYQGRCEIDIYNNGRELVATRELQTGDIMLMVNGGHGFRLLEDTVFLEVKQGPYTGIDEKERF
jgi:mannose-6-phosphate isomerase-like protein (cupin superfamily)